MARLELTDEMLERVEAIAAAERVSEPTARQRVSRGLAALRAHLRSQEP